MKISPQKAFKIAAIVGVVYYLNRRNAAALVGKAPNPSRGSGST
jgi:hypothetical protein